MTTTRLVDVVRDNREALAQGRALVEGLTDADYTRSAPACFNSTIGGHLRHVIEHYASFLQGLGEGEVDYEARPRDARIETDPAHAAATMETLDAELAELAEASGDRRVRVRAESAGAEGGEAWGDSSALRELEFLLSHTVHHYALIGVIRAVYGQGVPPDFGVAPSTLRHRRALLAQGVGV